MNAMRSMLLLASLLITPALAESGPPSIASLTLPETIDPSRRYLFYLHGAWIEDHGLTAAHPDFGRYQYAEIVHALSDRGFVVISEPRLHEVDSAVYAQLVERQVTALLEKGVPPARASGIGILRTPVRAPNANAICERFLRSVRAECLDHLLIVGGASLASVLRRYCSSCNSARPHQGIRRQVPDGPTPAVDVGRRIVEIPVLGGLHHEYRRAA
jgi:Integrase core domain